MSENGHERPDGRDGSRTQSRKQEPENKKWDIRSNFKNITIYNCFILNIITYIQFLSVVVQT